MAFHCYGSIDTNKKERAIHCHLKILTRMHIGYAITLLSLINMIIVTSQCRGVILYYHNVVIIICNVGLQRNPLHLAYFEGILNDSFRFCNKFKNVFQLETIYMYSLLFCFSLLCTCKSLIFMFDPPKINASGFMQ